MFLKPFVADWWILVSSLHRTGRQWWWCSGARGRWRPASSTASAQAVWAVDAGTGARRPVWAVDAGAGARRANSGQG
jgi:hypothetical protein